VAVQVAHWAAFADWIPECVDPAVADSIVSVDQVADYVDFAALVVD